MHDRYRGYRLRLPREIPSKGVGDIGRNDEAEGLAGCVITEKSLGSDVPYLNDTCSVSDDECLIQHFDDPAIPVRVYSRRYVFAILACSLSQPVKLAAPGESARGFDRNVEKAVDFAALAGIEYRRRGFFLDHSRSVDDRACSKRGAAEYRHLDGIG
jgi:hypothetical protein